MSKLYAGDVTPNDAWEILKSDSGAVLIDVRTTAEWHFIGTPDLASLNKKALLLEIRNLPNMDKNTNFEKTVIKIIQDQQTKIIFLCRSGVRSAEAATEMTKLGYSQCYNIAGGFEGELDSHSHRSKVSGWKASQLPWKQD